MKAPRVTVVIPTFNQSALLRACLESLKAQTFDSFSICVVDDGSSENIEDAVAGCVSEAKVIRLEENGGFAKAVNAGIRQCDTELVFLLNNDMTLEARALERLVHTVDSAALDMAAPVVVWRDEPEVLYSAGDRQRRNGRPESIGFRERREGFSHDEPVFGVSAGAGLYKRSLFEKLGYFDEGFEAYFEDSDFNFRARMAGYSAGCVPEAVAAHVGSASLEGRHWQRARLCCRNHALLVIKNVPLQLMVRYGPGILHEHVHQLGRLLSASRTEFGFIRAFFHVIRAEAEIMRRVPYTIGQRLRSRRNRSLSTAELDSLLSD